MTSFTPFLIGHGMSGKAMATAWSMIDLIDDDLDLAPISDLERGQDLKSVRRGNGNSVLLIANPHGLHAETLLDGIDAGFTHFVMEKPVCVRLEDVSRLRAVRKDVAVCHGFRQQWGPQTLRRMIEAGDFGEIISIEGVYWQSSAAQAALEGKARADWKNDRVMNGPYDALVDLGAHYTDLMLFLSGERPLKATGWVSHVNAPAPHRDTHAHVDFVFQSCRARGSISKTVHGAGNLLEINVLGAKQSAAWSMERMDELRIARGATTTIMQKPSDKFGSRLPPFHMIGWSEGYIEIIHNYLLAAAGLGQGGYPTRQEGLDAIEVLLNLEIP
jgi:predicted dehydrogenase